MPPPPCVSPPLLVCHGVHLLHWLVCHGVYLLACVSWCALVGLCVSWCALVGLCVMVCTCWLVCHGVHLLACESWCALVGLCVMHGVQVKSHACLSGNLTSCPVIHFFLSVTATPIAHYAKVWQSQIEKSVYHWTKNHAYYLFTL